MFRVFTSILHARLLQCLSLIAGGLLFASSEVECAGVLEQPVTAVPPLLTNILQIWTEPRQNNPQPYRIQTEVVIHYFDTDWSCAWGDCGGVQVWLPIWDCQVPLKAGQRVRIEGMLLPGLERIDWRRSRIKVLEEDVPLRAERVARLSTDPRGFGNRLIEAEGQVLRKSENARRVTLDLQLPDVAATLHVLKQPDEPVSALQPGDRIRFKAVFSPNFDKEGRVTEYNLWAGRTSFVEVVDAAEKPPAEPQDIAPYDLSHIYEIWTMPTARKQVLHRMKTEVVIYFYDAEWRNAWGECNGVRTYLPISDCPVVLRPGQRVEIDGYITPVRERFDWDRTRVRVLEESVPLVGESVYDLTQDPQGLKGRLIWVDGLVDRLLEDATHCTMTFMGGNTVSKAYVLKEAGKPLRFKPGDFVRIKCVYSPQLDLEGKVSDLSLFVPEMDDIKVIGSLETDARFGVAVSPVESIQEDSPTNSLIHVSGVVRSHDPGRWVKLWDATGQVIVESKQTHPLRFGDRIEAVGYPYISGIQQCLRGGLYRSASSTDSASGDAAGLTALPLRLAERVRDLGREEARRGMPVVLRGIVTWAHPETPFAYVQDASGGLRVVNPTWGELEARKPGTIVTVQGRVCEGEFVPVITNAVIHRVGFWNLEEGRPVTLEQAMTGVEDGRWIQMRGFVRQVSQWNGLARFSLATSSGEFEVWTPATQSFDSWRGSTIRVQGVCASISNPRHQLTGIQLWAPEVKYMQVEEPAPSDLFAVAARPLDSLRLFNAQNTLNQMVRTFGTVVLQVPGSYLYVQDGVDSVLALSQQPDLVKPGDRVEVVGFPGNEGRRVILREAAYRRVSTGPEPNPVDLSKDHSVTADLEGLLAKAEGTLLNKVQKDREVRLLIQTRESAFEASLSSASVLAARQMQFLRLGSRVAATGVYQAQNDEYGNPRSFLLRLRSWGDIRVMQQPPWWTLSRLLSLLLAVLIVSLVVFYWGIVLSRKNAQLRHAQNELQIAHNKLELRVEERTRELQERTLELQEEVAAKDRAREELAEAQRDLMTASRQAGMAEVATGVLHNVGNVLNSVNISVAIVRDKLVRSSNSNLDKVLSLLNEHRKDLSQFLTTDSKGRKVVEYLELFNRHLRKESGEVLQELVALTQNVEHIKEIVAMQQSYAQASGVTEILHPAELLEDAIRMHAAAYDRHAVKLVREYGVVPPIAVDRHKTLQILTNLLHNAKYACEEKGAGLREVRVRVQQVDANRIRMEVADNGVGIPPENLTRIFSFGFTTRRNGHGFGLHSGALAAREMGGVLGVDSQGVGRGATFALELPINNQSTTVS